MMAETRASIERAVIPCNDARRDELSCAGQPRCMMRVWAKDQPFGAELADVNIGGGMLSANGVTIGTDPIPYQVEYQLTATDGYVTTQLAVRTQGDGWRRALNLARAPSGTWSGTSESHGNVALPAPGGDLRGVAGALDCDLGLSPLTNSMPVLRHSLHQGGGSVDFLMAWVSVPDLAVYPSRQRYTFVRHEPGGHVVRFESLDDDFVAEILFDDDGIVLDYPGIGRIAAPDKHAR